MYRFPPVLENAIFSILVEKLHFHIYYCFQKIPE